MKEFKAMPQVLYDRAFAEALCIYCLKDGYVYIPQIYQAVPDTYEASMKNSSGQIYVGSMWTFAFDVEQLLGFLQNEVERRPSVQVIPEELIMHTRNFQTLQYEIQKEEESVEKGEDKSSSMTTAFNISSVVEKGEATHNIFDIVEKGKGRSQIW